MRKRVRRADDRARLRDEPRGAVLQRFGYHRHVEILQPRARDRPPAKSLLAAWIQTRDHIHERLLISSSASGCF